MSNVLLIRRQWASAKPGDHPTDVVFVDCSKAFDKISQTPAEETKGAWHQGSVAALGRDSPRWKVLSF